MNNSDNNDRPERDLQSFQEKTLNYIVSNLLPVLSVTSLLVGGFIFWLYYFNIRYFPDLNFNESVLFLLVAAITGVVIIVVLAILIIFPYILHSLVLKQQNHTGLSSDEDLTPHQQPLPIDPENFNYFENFWYFLSMFIVCYVIFLELFLKPYVELELECKWMYFAYLSFLAVLLVNLFIYDRVCKLLKKLREKASKNSKPMRGVRAWIVSIIILMLVFIAVINPIVFNENSLLVANKNSLPLSYLAIFVLICLANIMFAYYVDEQKNIVLAVIFIIVIVLLLFFLGDVNISKVVMRMYKFGNFEASQLLVDKEGCMIVKNLKIPSPIENDNTCSIQNIKVLSSLGDSFYIESVCKPPLPCRQPLRFTIPSKNVLSWSIIPPQERKTDD